MGLLLDWDSICELPSGLRCLASVGRGATMLPDACSVLLVSIGLCFFGQWPLDLHDRLEAPTESSKISHPAEFPIYHYSSRTLTISRRRSNRPLEGLRRNGRQEALRKRVRAAHDTSSSATPQTFPHATHVSTVFLPHSCEIPRTGYPKQPFGMAAIQNGTSHPLCPTAGLRNQK